MLSQVFDTYGKLGVEALKQDVDKVSATGKTRESIRYEVTQDGTIQGLQFYARMFFKAMETGRGPRKSDQYQEFDKYMLEYMQARGIGADLSPKKRQKLAKFLVWKINKEGDKTYKEGGRIVYSPTLTRIIKELTEAVKKDVIGMFISEIRSAAKAA